MSEIPDNVREMGARLVANNRNPGSVMLTPEEGERMRQEREAQIALSKKQSERTVRNHWRRALVGQILMGIVSSPHFPAKGERCNEAIVDDAIDLADAALIKLEVREASDGES